MPTTPRALGLVATAAFAVAALAGCAGSDDAPEPAASTAAAEPVASAAPTEEADAGGDAPAFTGWPAQVGGYTTDDDSAAEAVTYISGDNEIVMASTTPYSLEENSAVYEESFEVGDNAVCGGFQGEIMCTVEFQDRTIDLISFSDADSATTFVNDFLAAQGA